MVGGGEERDGEWRESGNSLPALLIFRDYCGNQINCERILKTREGPQSHCWCLLLPILLILGLLYKKLKFLPNSLCQAEGLLLLNWSMFLFGGLKWGWGVVTYLGALRIALEWGWWMFRPHFGGNRRTFLQGCSRPTQDQVTSFLSRYK